MVEKNLGTRTAGAGIGHRPKIVALVLLSAFLAADADHAFVRDRDLFCPNPECLVIGFINGDPQSFRIETEDLCEQFPGVADCILLEIVAETEISEHLEEGMVTSGVSDLIKVIMFSAGTNALLRRNRPRIAALLSTEKNILELNHARIGEQQSRIIGRNQRARIHDFMFSRGEKIEEIPAN